VSLIGKNLRYNDSHNMPSQHGFSQTYSSNHSLKIGFSFTVDYATKYVECHSHCV